MKFEIFLDIYMDLFSQVLGFVCVEGRGQKYKLYKFGDFQNKVL